ncbi:MAG: VTT domain-containing protein [Chloroflexota bacterium]
MKPSHRLALARVLALLVVIVITVLIYKHREQAKELEMYGYPGIFLISVIANATVILPVPGLLITFSMGAVFHPIGVALASGLGAAFGEMTGYLAGFSGQAIIENAKLYTTLTGWMRKNGFLTILILAFIPNPFFDLAGMSAGAFRMPVYRFLLWCFLGKTLKMLVFAYAGATSIPWLLKFQP